VTTRPSPSATKWSLADRDGRARAEGLGVMEVPTVVIAGGERIVGVPEDAHQLHDRILAAAARLAKETRLPARRTRRARGAPTRCWSTARS